MNEIDYGNADIIFSLGTIDWLSTDEINYLNLNSFNKLFFHSFSEKNLSLSILIHQIYVFLAYAWKTNNYKPIYYSKNQIIDLFNKHSLNKKNFYSNKKLRFGSFFANFNLNKDI